MAGLAVVLVVTEEAPVGLAEAIAAPVVWEEVPVVPEGWVAVPAVWEALVAPAVICRRPVPLAVPSAWAAGAITAVPGLWAATAVPAAAAAAVPRP